MKSICLLAVLAATFAACNRTTTNTTQTQIISTSTHSSSKTNAETTETVVFPPSRGDKFPESWFGNWIGTLEIYNAKGLSQSIPMECNMAPTDTAGVFTWNIIYGTDRVKGLRPYLLRTVDAAKGQYLCDEMNTIKMESYLLGNKLFCSYIVEGNAIVSTYEKTTDGKMLFEIIFGKEKIVSTTGGAKVGDETIPPVRTMPVLISQKAILMKKK